MRSINTDVDTKHPNNVRLATCHSHMTPSLKCQTTMQSEQSLMMPIKLRYPFIAHSTIHMDRILCTRHALISFLHTQTHISTVLIT